MRVPHPRSRRRALGLVLALSVAALSTGAASAAVNPLAQSPTVNRTHVVFAWGGYLWSASRAGGTARRLTYGGHEGKPIFSPDGKWIAYSGQYDGAGFISATRADVYVIPAEGGKPRRITWHPGADLAVGWTPDSRRILFRSNREAFALFDRLYTVAVEGGAPQVLPLPRGEEGSFSPDAARVAYVPNAQWQPYFKRYRGGQTTPIQLARLDTLEIEKVPRRNSNDSQPVWIGDKVYFLSDRDGPVGLYAYDTKTKAVRRLIDNHGLDLTSLTAGPDVLVYEQFGDVFLFDTATGRSRKVDLRIDETPAATRPRSVTLGDKAEPVALSASPDGRRALVEARGEILEFSLGEGAPSAGRNLTGTSNAAERDPSWSPDGRLEAWFSDASGAYALHLREAGEGGAVRKIALPRTPIFDNAPVWSPDGRTIAFEDIKLNLMKVDVASGRVTPVTGEPGGKTDAAASLTWSPDSRFLAFSRIQPNRMWAVFLHGMETGQTVQISDPLVDARYPAFDRGGRLLVFAAGTDTGLASSLQDMSAYYRPTSRALYGLVLDRDGAWPPATPAVTTGPIKLDLEGLSRRIVALPVPAANYVGVQAGPAGVLFLNEAPGTPVKPQAALFGPAALSRLDLASGKIEPLAKGVNSVTVGPNGETLSYRQRREWFTASTRGVFAPRKLDISATAITIDPRAEWTQMYREVWRSQRDQFYAPNHHGLDFAAAEKRYAAYLPRLGGRADLNALFREAMGGLSVGHLAIVGGDIPDSERSTVGLLGADFVAANGRWRIDRILESDPWEPRATSPLSRWNLQAKAGDYLLAVAGKPVTTDTEIYSYFQGTAGKPTSLLLGPNPDGTGAREVTVTPIADETGLRLRDWEEQNRRTVERLSGGRLAYVHMADTSPEGYAQFNRFYFGQVGKEGAVIDTRFNGGGAVADYVVDVLARPLHHCIQGSTAARHCTPLAQIYGPKTMLINEMQGSGGDALPWMFRDRKVGPLVGRRTWGGLVSRGDAARLIDGGAVAAPSLAHYGLNGGWEIENIGLSPDIDVEDDIAALREGRDVQLETAVAVTLDALARHPVVIPPPPPWPDYSAWKGETR